MLQQIQVIIAVL